MRITNIILISCIFNFVVGVLHCPAEVKSESYYRTLWYKTEKSYMKEQEVKAQEEADKRDVRLYMEMGREYLVNNDLPAALVCFRDIIDLESDMSKKQHTAEAKKLVVDIDNKLKEGITRDLGGILKQDFNRRREGAKRILAAVAPSEPAPFIAPPREVKLAAPAAAPKQQPPVAKADEELVRRKAVLEAEIAAKRVKIDAELEVKRLELAKKQMEIDSLLYLAKEMIKDGDYGAAIKQAEKIFVIDQNNARAKEVIDTANKKIEREKYFAQKKVDDARLTAEREKKKREEMAKADEEKKKREIQSHFDKGLGFLRSNQFLESTGEFKYVLELDPYNSQAKFYLLEIKSRLERAISDLKKPVDPIEVPIKNKLKTETQSSEKKNTQAPAVAESTSPVVKNKLR